MPPPPPIREIMQPLLTGPNGNSLSAQQLPVFIWFTVSPSTTIVKGKKYELRWEASNAVECRGFGDWSGEKPLKGKASYIAKKNNKYYFVCDSSDNESRTESVSVKVKNPPAKQTQKKTKPKAVNRPKK